ncbi:unnamed protein product [Clonostachys rhizophaga]|uniref:Rho termination factor N-terminal domain-containing protein n=1 Tax=Clonostachys rhizophaga TaxID=160324 RepID=A0A9N9VMX0_9HYPO|nr:unnamed protein product [Clonostachys rhizophaga]
MSSPATNNWLRTQLKKDLLELAKKLGLKNIKDLKKPELEASLDEYLTENASRLSGKTELQGYYNSHYNSRSRGSPLKREAKSPVKREVEPKEVKEVKQAVKTEAERELKVAKRRVSRLAEEILQEAETPRASSTAVVPTTTALVQTPARSLSQQVMAQLSELPATPADIARSVDRSTTAVRTRVSSIYQETGINEVTEATRSSLSTVHSIVFLVSLFELYFIRREILADKYAFTIPAISFFKTSDYPVYLPDMFLLLTGSFWSPAFAWALTSFIVPTFFGYFFNLNAASTSSGPRTRSRSHVPEYLVDPVSFSIAKALFSYVVYAQGVTFGGLLSDVSIERLAGAVYGGYKGVLTGTAITGLISMYDAVLRK